MSVVDMPGERRVFDATFLQHFRDDTADGDFDVYRFTFDELTAGLAASPDAVAATIASAVEAVAALAALDPGFMDADTLKALATGVEGLRRQIDAAATAVAEHVDVTAPFTADGWFTAKRWLKHTLQLSGPEAFARVQAARFRSRVPEWAQAQAQGRVGVAQCKVMASIAANPRIDNETLAAGAVVLLDDAIRLPFDHFERFARTWEALADPHGALAAAERARLRRDTVIRARHDGGWDLHAVLDDIAGAEVQEILAWFFEAEFRTDWAEATQRLGHHEVTMSDLQRSEPQRRADALVAMARAAAATPPGSKRPVPTVNIIIDVDTLAAWTNNPNNPDNPDNPDPADPAEAAGPAGGRVPVIDPGRYREVTCRTERGHRIHPAHVVETTLWGMIRRVVIDSRSVIIDLGRRSRLFTGPAREAVMLLEETCIWTGCDQPEAWCDADHLDGWAKARGPTKSSNGAPLCHQHNVLKEQGFTVTRDTNGNWHVYAPDGHEIT